MPHKDFLTTAQQLALQNVLREKNQSLLRQRALILLLRNDGKTYAEIASFVGCSYGTAAYWATHVDPDNLETLKDQRSRGNARKATPAYRSLLHQVAQTSPETLGLTFARWSTLRLAEYMTQHTNIQLTGTQVWRLLKSPPT